MHAVREGDTLRRARLTGLIGERVIELVDAIRDRDCRRVYRLRGVRFTIDLPPPWVWLARDSTSRRDTNRFAVHRHKSQ